MRVLLLWLGIAAAISPAVSADEAVAPATLTQTASAHSMAEAFQAAWQRHPAQRSDAFRADAVAAQQAAAKAWFPEPPSVALAHRNDALNRDQGVREWEAELAVPIWLPGQQDRHDHPRNAQTSTRSLEPKRKRPGAASGFPAR